jgi:hypothetical protein
MVTPLRSNGDCKVHLLRSNEDCAITLRSNGDCKVLLGDCKVLLGVCKVLLGVCKVLLGVCKGFTPYYMIVQYESYSVDCVLMTCLHIFFTMSGGLLLLLSMILKIVETKYNGTSSASKPK